MRSACQGGQRKSWTLSFARSPALSLRASVCSSFLRTKARTLRSGTMTAPAPDRANGGGGCGGTKQGIVVMVAILYGFCLGIGYERMSQMRGSGTAASLWQGKLPPRCQPRGRRGAATPAVNKTEGPPCPPCPAQATGAPSVAKPVVAAGQAAPKAALDDSVTGAFVRTMFHLQDEMKERERILMDEIVKKDVERIREQSTRPYVSASPNLSTGVTCYEFGSNNLRLRMGRKPGKVSASGVCVYERLCWEGSGFVAKWSKDDTDASYPFATFATDRNSFDWPPCLTCTTKVTAREVSGATFADDQVWIEEPTFLPVHSYERHVTHFMESITSINAAVHRLTAEQLYGAQTGKKIVVQLVNHAAKMFAWQQGVVEVAVGSPDLVVQQGPPKGNVCYKRALIPGYVFELFNDAISADEFRRDAYAALKLPPPGKAINEKQLIFARRTSKRTMLNRETVLKLIPSIPTFPGITVKVTSVIQGKLSFLEQVRNMRESRVLVGMHGADLTNCMFLPVGSVVIEINPLNWYDSRFVRMCETAGVHYLSYNVGNAAEFPNAPYPFAHYPSLQCSFIDKPLIDCHMEHKSRMPKRESNVEVDMDKFLAIVAEAFAMVGWGPRVVYPAFKEDWDLLKAFRWDGQKVLKWEPSLQVPEETKS